MYDDDIQGNDIHKTIRYRARPEKEKGLCAKIGYQ